MSENKAIKINEKIEIPKLRLWLIWLLLFVFPSIASILCFNYLSKEYKYFVNTDLIYEGFEKIKKYNDLIVPENYIENQQSIIQNLNTNISPEKLKEQIDSIILGETSYCIFFDEDFNNVKIVKKTDAKNLSLPLLKRYFKTLVKDYYLKEQNPTLYQHVRKSWAGRANRKTKLGRFLVQCSLLLLRHRPLREVFQLRLGPVAEKAQLIDGGGGIVLPPEEEEDARYKHHSDKQGEGKIVPAFLFHMNSPEKR